MHRQAGGDEANCAPQGGAETGCTGLAIERMMARIRQRDRQ
jgi:hypothetical protein